MGRGGLSARACEDVDGPDLRCYGQPASSPSRVMGDFSYPSNGTPPTANRGPEMGLWRSGADTRAAHPYGLPELPLNPVAVPPAGHVDAGLPGLDWAHVNGANTCGLAARCLAEPDFWCGTAARTLDGRPVVLAGFLEGKPPDAVGVIAHGHTSL